VVLKIFSNKMSIEEFSWNENSTDRNNNFLLPRSIRGLIVGKSGCGKTNLFLNLLLRDFLDYNNL
jgi:predicted GTPase